MFPRLRFGLVRDGEVALSNWPEAPTRDEGNAPPNGEAFRRPPVPAW